MKPKHIFLFVLSLSFSFSIVLGLVVVLGDPPTPPKVKTKKTVKRRSQLRPAAPLADRRSAKTAQVPTAKNQAPESTQPVAPIIPIQQQKPKPVRAIPGAGLAATSKEIQLFKKELRKQLTVLEQDRNNMISQLARKLAVTTPGKAAAEIRGLDDETAVLVLKNMSASPRLNLLKHLDNQKVERLNRHIKKL